MEKEIGGSAVHVIPKVFKTGRYELWYYFLDLKQK